MSETIDFINSILFWVFLFVLVWQAYYLLFGKGVPNISTAPAIRKAIIEKLKDLKSKNPIIYDLGCANGQFTREMARALPHAQIIGIEISKMEYLQAVFLKKLLRIKNVSYIKSDFYKVDLSNADAVFMFQLGRDMGDMRPKLEKDLKPGTLVIANKFKIGGNWEPVEVCTIKTLAPAQKTFYVYRV
jgi:precorrin-6B methylase 2